MTSDALAKNPVFYSGTVNHPSDPLKRGRCGPGRCGNQVLDFLDVMVGFDGVPCGAFVDACPQVCAGPTELADLGNDGLVGGPRPALTPAPSGDSLGPGEPVPLRFSVTQDTGLEC